MEMQSEKDAELFDEKEGGEEPSEITEGQRRIHFTTPDRKIQDLHTDYRRGDLDTRPPFQLGYVWDQKKASRLIESVILRVPIPVIYTAEEQDGSEIVIDGQQRLLSLFSFIDNSFPKTGEPFKLTGLDVLKELNGTAFKDWDRPRQKQFQSYSLSMITITKDSDKDVRFEIFERLNTGSVKLNDQELRNCVFRGSYNDFIRELADNADFQFILNSPALHERMLDSEFVLRFFTFQQTNFTKYKGSMKQFLNKEISSRRELKEAEKKELRATFKKSVELTRTVFGEKAFRRLVLGSAKNRASTWEERKVNRGLYDILMYGFSLYEKRDVVPFADPLREELLWLSTSNDMFIDALSGSGTDSKDKIQLKFETWISSLRDILGYSKPEPRAFSRELKERIWKANPTCAYEYH